MKRITLLLIVLFTANSFAQINYESGYFIDNEGIKTECLIRNVGWNNNPTSFDYKLNENSDSKQKFISEIKEFNVGNSYKYKRFKLQIDRSGNMFNSLDDFKEPKWNEETLFLKILVEGETNLYQYDSEGISKFFISSGNHEKVEQLVYKEYSENDDVNGMTLRENNSFRQQLFVALKSDILTEKDFRNVKYKSNELTDLFLKYNNQKESKTINFDSKQNKNSLNLKVTIAINNTSFDFKYNYYDSDNLKSYNSNSKPALALGFEFEDVLPFNQKKWALFVNPSFQSTHIEASYDNKMNYKIEKLVLDYKFIDIYIGFRHYMFLNNKSKLFLNAGYLLGVNLNSYLSNDYKIDNTSSLFTGLGYNYNKFGLELRYNFNRNLIPNYPNSEAQFKSAGLVLSYKFL